MSRDTATGVGLTCIVAYEAFAYLTGRPKITDLSRRYPVLAQALARAWLLHVSWKVKEAIAELEDCEWH